MELAIQRLAPDVPMPQYATPGSAAMDLTAHLDSPLTIQPGSLVRIPTGLAVALPGPQYVALVFARSGLATSRGICLSNGVGVIDSDYRGEISIGLTNLSNQAYTLQPGDRIAQLAVVPVVQPVLREVAALEETQRGAGGFGSTGR